jgi:hypothetical protein
MDNSLSNPTSPPPQELAALSSQEILAACEDDARTVDLCAVSREIATYRKATGQPHAIPPRRVIIKPASRRPARARAVHSRASHGGSRKAGDGGGGDGPPPPIFVKRVYRLPDGGVRFEEDDPKTKTTFVAEFSSVAEAARELLDVEQLARAAGAWFDRPLLDPAHPLYPLIREGLQ